MKRYTQTLAGVFVAASALNLFPINQAQAQDGCYNGIVLENASLASTGTKASWTVPAGRIGKSVSRTFTSDNAGGAGLTFVVEVVRGSRTYLLESRFSNLPNPRYESDLPIFLEAGDTIRMRVTRANIGRGDFTISVANCPDPFSP